MKNEENMYSFKDILVIHACSWCFCVIKSHI